VTLACGTIGGTKRSVLLRTVDPVGAAISYEMTAEQASAIVKSLLDSISGMIQKGRTMRLSNLAHPLFFLVSEAPSIDKTINTMKHATIT